MIKYITEDYKIFDTPELAEKHSKELEAEKRKKELLENERTTRLKEIRIAYENYVDLVNKFDKDYGYGADDAWYDLGFFF